MIDWDIGHYEQMALELGPVAEDLVDPLGWVGVKQLAEDPEQLQRRIGMLLAQLQERPRAAAVLRRR